MTLQIPEELLKATKLDERQIMLELACRLFDIERLSLNQAARLAGMNRAQFEDELHDRGIAIYRYTLEDFQQDQETLTKIRKNRG